MILRQITLNNIRSYHSHPPIELSTGVTLFEGDIGSGKSTILSAIEFALFGLGDVSGTYLLRHGQKKGFVLLEFSINLKTYKVFRSLKRRGKSVTQKEGYIIEEGRRTDYSVTEMKTRILKILNFNERPRPKTSSLIYRYAIFTPQEMMKEVLFQRVEKRLETLRRAFRVEDYSTIANNASIILDWLDREIEFLKRQTVDIDDKRLLLDEEKKKIAEYQTELESFRNVLEDLEKNREGIYEKMEKIQYQKEEVIKLQAEIPLIQANLDQKAKIIKNTLENIDQSKKELEDIEKAEKLLARISPQFCELRSSKEKMEKLEPDLKKLQELTNEKTKLITAIQYEKNNIEKQKKTIRQNLKKITDWLSKNKPETLDIPKIESEERFLREEVNNLPLISENLDQKKQKKSAIIQEIKGKKEEQSQLRDELSNIKRIGIGAPCPKCKQELTQKHYERIQMDYVKKIEDFEEKISELTDKRNNLGKEIDIMANKKKAIEETNAKLMDIQKKLAELRKQKEAVMEKETECTENELLLKDLENKIAKDTYCETERKKMLDVGELLKELLPIKNECEKIKKKIKDFENDKIEQKYHRNNEKISNKDKVQSDLKECQKKIIFFKEDLEKEKKDFKSKKKDFENNKCILAVFEQLEAEKKDLGKKVDAKKEDIIAKRKDIENFEKESKRIGAEIQTKEEQLLKFDELKQYELWLSDYFIPALKVIESHMLANINNEFNYLFQKWITHLLEAGDIVVSVDENFSPKILQSGYEIDVKSLSGGEKTSVALAYRLALNVMVKKVCEAMQSNLLILDEPTDGFSREQLSRLREILNDLKCEQVIIVSHENELEGFVDNIFRIIKDSGESKIIST